MPSNLIKSYADKTGLSIEEVEKKWNEAKEKVKDGYPKVKEDSDSFYALTTSIFKKLLKIKEESANATTTTTTMGGESAIYKRKMGDTLKRIDSFDGKKQYNEGTILDKLNYLIENKK